MSYDKTLINGKLLRWESYLDQYSLPSWKDIPDIGLYMEQVISLLRDYLDYLPPELKEEEFITSAAVNNYVRKKIMPEPVKKKYYRVHIAYLILICTLKQCLSIPTLQTIIPMGLSEDEVRVIYSSFIGRHHLACEYFIGQTRQLASSILGYDEPSAFAASNTEELIMTSAILSGLSRLLSEKLLLLNGKTLEDGGPILEAAESE